MSVYHAFAAAAVTDARLRGDGFFEAGRGLQGFLTEQRGDGGSPERGAGTHRGRARALGQRAARTGRRRRGAGGARVDRPRALTVEVSVPIVAELLRHVTRVRGRSADGQANRRLGRAARRDRRGSPRRRGPATEEGAPRLARG